MLIQGKYFTSISDYPIKNDEYINQMNVYDRSEYERKYFDELFKKDNKDE